MFKGLGEQGTQNVLILVLRILVLFAVIGFTSVSALVLFGDGYWQLALMIVIIGVFNVVAFSRPEAEAWRWLSPGLSLFLLFVLFPLVSTIVFAFTNYGTTNSLTKPQVIDQFEGRRYLPEGAATYNFTMFQSTEDDTIGLWMTNEEGATFFVRENGVIEYAESDVTDADGDGTPETVGAYRALERRDAALFLRDLGESSFGEAPNVVQLSRSAFGVASETAPRYEYLPEQDALYDKLNDITYVADDTRGFFVNQDNPDSLEDRIPAGYRVFIGWGNFERFITSPASRGPVVQILIWNFTFALSSVFFAFVLGLTAALVFDGKGFFNRVVKTGLILPWAIPSVITILIWNGLLNPLDGVYANAISDIARFFGHEHSVGWPPIYSDPTWARVSLLVVNTWFAFPYFMLICSGALQAIPSDLYEAAQLDGANIWQQFWHMTLPLLLLTVGPLLIGSFAVNFNSFELIYIFNEGGPPIVGSTTPAGHTDLLISYVYKLSFAGGGGRQEFGYAAAITIIIFILLAGITIYNLRFMNIWEETGQNV